MQKHSKIFAWAVVAVIVAAGAESEPGAERRI